MKSQLRLFTLIELMVVIGIIAILAALLLPVLQKAKAVAWDADCKSRQRQMLTALYAYTNDYDSWLCSGAHGSAEGVTDYDGGYHTDLGPYIYSGFEKSNMLYGGGTGACGIYAAGYKGYRYTVFMCPSPTSLSGATDLTRAKAPMFLSYSYNWSVLPNRCYVTNKYQKIHSFKASTTYVWVCGNWEGAFRGINTATGTVPAAWQVNWLAHNNGENVSFLDGHVARCDTWNSVINP